MSPMRKATTPRKQSKPKSPLPPTLTQATIPELPAANSVTTATPVTLNPIGGQMLTGDGSDPAAAFATLPPRLQAAIQSGTMSLGGALGRHKQFQAGQLPGQQAAATQTALAAPQPLPQPRNSGPVLPPAVPYGNDMISQPVDPFGHIGDPVPQNPLDEIIRNLMGGGMGGRGGTAAGPESFGRMPGLDEIIRQLMGMPNPDAVMGRGSFARPSAGEAGNRIPFSR